MPTFTFIANYLVCLFLVLFSIPVFSQHYSRVDSIPVKQNGSLLKMPWMGGLNHCLFSTVDINADGKKDLIAFDRTGNKLSTFINAGTAGEMKYFHAPEYAQYFPHMEEWMLMIDYNCDGKEDIFTYHYSEPRGITVYKNVSTPTALKFELAKTYLQADAQPLYMSTIGVPAIEDVDNDGDKDVLMFEAGGWTLVQYTNKSKEIGYGCDSLIFSKTVSCWGNFTEVSSTCSATLNTCNPQPAAKQTQSKEGEKRNGGSCLLCLDMDADGDKELYMGQLGCCSAVLLTNGGSPTTANMTAITASFPASYPINMSSFPCSYFLDLNNDDKRDLLVSSSSPSASANYESVWYYENIGADNAPVFNKKTKKLFQKEMIDVGEGSSPAFFDYNNDGLTDLLVSNYARVIDSCYGKTNSYVLAYKNIGTATSPMFELADTNFANLSNQLPNAYSSHLTFGDLDKDGDQDMFAGDYLGLLHYFDNSAGAGNPANFIISNPINYKDAAGNQIDIGSYSTPQLIDTDRDGDLDLIIGEAAGNINYYQNIGTPTVPSYSFITNSLGGVDVMKSCCTGYSVPLMYDSLGSYRLLIGSEANKQVGETTGKLWYYKNIDGNLNGQFTLIDSTYQHIWEGVRMNISGNDINGDGKMDLGIGNYAGGVAIYMGDTLITSIKNISVIPFDFSVFPNPASYRINIHLSERDIAVNNYSLKLYNLMGELLLEEKIKQTQYTLPLNLPNGIYICEINNGTFRQTKKLAVFR